MLHRPTVADATNKPMDCVESQLGDLMALLLKAHQFAEDVDRTHWDFATEIKSLRKNGISNADFRWLVCNGYLEHRKEVTRRRDSERRFRDEQQLTFSKKTCFVLTSAGVAFARDIVRDQKRPAGLPSGSELTVDGRYLAVTKLIPHWNPQRHELTVEQKVVKRFRWPANNQETVLMAFEEDGWPDRIDDPLPPQPEQDPKRRLHDTIKCLNRNQINQSLRFHGDGTGQGVRWDLVSNLD